MRLGWDLDMVQNSHHDGCTGQSQANEIDMSTLPLRASYVFERDSDLGGKQHEEAYVHAFARVLASVSALLGYQVTVGYKGRFLSADDGIERMSEFSRSVYWDQEDAVRLPLTGSELELLCNADPIAFALLSRGERFP